MTIAMRRNTKNAPAILVLALFLLNPSEVSAAEVLLSCWGNLGDLQSLKFLANPLIEKPPLRRRCH